MSTPNFAEVIAEALAKHHDTGEHSCDYHCAEVDGTNVSIVKRAKRNRDPKPIPHQVLVALAYRLKRAAK